MIISTHSLFLHSWEIKAGVGRSGNEKYIGGWYLPVGKRVYYVVWQRLKRNEKDFCHYQLADFLYCRDAYQKWCVTDTCTLGMYSSKTKKGDWIATHVQCHVLIIIQRSLETIPCIYVNNGLECSGFSVSLRNISYSYAMVVLLALLWKQLSLHKIAPTMIFSVQVFFTSLDIRQHS